MQRRESSLSASNHNNNNSRSQPPRSGNGKKLRRRPRKKMNSLPLFVLLVGILLGLCLGLAVMYAMNLHATTTTTATTPNDRMLLPGKSQPSSQKQHDHLRQDNNNNMAGQVIHMDTLTMGGGSSQKPPNTNNGKNDYPYDLTPIDPSYDIAKEFYVKGGKRFAEYTSGDAPVYSISDTLRTRSDTVARSRRALVKQSMEFAWSGYCKYAFGMDELKPQTGRGDNGWGGQGITLVDSLDTLWLMDMKQEFNEARDWVASHLDHSNVGFVSMFETTIRDLGGLLSAYDWSGDKVFLEKAVDLGERLLHGFDESDSGIPFGQVNLKNGRNQNIGWTGNNAILAEFGTLQIEFRYLAKATGRPELKEKVEKVFEIMKEIAPENGLYPYFYRNSNLRGNNLPQAANNKITFGAMSDSFYEYMLKCWLQGGKTEPLYREMYDKAIQGMHDELLQTSEPSGLVYIADKNSGRIDKKMDHLVCFMGGLLALGAYTDPRGLESERAQRDLKTARGITYTCYQMYARMETGISAEFVQFRGGDDFVSGNGAPHYLLRPEAVESFFILNQLTGDPVYREWGWEVYQAIEKYCKTKYAYGSLTSVHQTNASPRDKMESFFLAETLKYLYLLQDPDTPVDVLNKHVFNTEAHPLRIFPVFEQETTASQ